MSKEYKNEKQTKNMSSIARKLHGQMVGKKLGAFFGADILLFFGMSFMWLLATEAAAVGKAGTGTPKLIDFGLTRKIYSEGSGLTNLTYEVLSGDTVILKQNIFAPFLLISVIVLVVIAFQIFDLIFSYYFEHKKIKDTLMPINEIALKADELTKLSFDDAKYHTIENAIEHISPENTTELSLGDSDLKGIEAAMNNMLKRMHDTYLQQTRFVNDASHELRTPISVIQGYANMLDRWGKEDEAILNESIAAIKSESDHMNHLVEQLLFLARGDAGRNTMTFEDVSLNDIINEIYEESLMIDEKHVYRLAVRDGNVRLKADPSMIKQAMRILVDNAAKYTKEGDEIILSVGYMGSTDGAAGKPYIQVQDSGMGMAEVDVRHMFERFYRADDTRKVQGTGLGLSIAKWIVDRHGGHFEILSRKDIGTRIKIVFDQDEKNK